MKKFAIYAAIASIACVSTNRSEVHATPPTLLYQAADDYRDAVVDFERHVLRAKYIERVDERLVDALEDQTSDLRSAARRYQDLPRLEHEWRVTQNLHADVEAAIFGRSCYPRNPQLELCWREVQYRFTILAQQLSRVCNHSPYGNFGANFQPSWGRSISVVIPSSRSRRGDLHRDHDRHANHSHRTMPNLLAPQLSIPSPFGFPSGVTRLPTPNTRLPSRAFNLPSR